MDIVEFFQQCAGEWMMQRTSRNLNLNTSEASRTKLMVEMLLAERSRNCPNLPATEP
jgi:hypothetical protein